jgi:hypothetical protein
MAQVVECLPGKYTVLSSNLPCKINESEKIKTAHFKIAELVVVAGNVTQW